MKTILILLLVSVASYAQPPINRNGLKYERILRVTPAIKSKSGTDSIAATITVVETGRIVGIEIPIPVDSTVSMPHKRTLELTALREDFDLEMTVETRVNYYTPDGTMLMVDAIDADSTLSPDVKTLSKRTFQSFQLAPKSTRNSWINPATGGRVVEGTAGAIREIQFYQVLSVSSLTNMGIITSAITQPQLMRYRMLAFQLRTIAARIGL